MSESIQAELETARKLAKSDKLTEAENAYRGLLEKSAGSNEKAIQAQEQALYELGKLYRDHRYVCLLWMRSIVFELLFLTLFATVKLNS